MTARWGRRLGWGSAVLIPLAFLSVFFAWPVAALIGRGFVQDGAFSLEGFRFAFSSARTWRIIGLTLAQAVVGTVASVLLGVPGAYLLYRCRFPGRRLLRAVVGIPFVLPTVVVGVAFRALLAEQGPLGFLGLDETFAAIVAALVFFNYAVIVRTVGGLWAHLDPRTAEAARTLGASPARVFWSVTLPALGPAIASAGSLVFLFCASAFGIVMVMGGVRFATIETEIWYQTTQLLDLGVAAALSITQLVVVTASLLVANRARARNERALRLRATISSEQRWRASRDWAPTLITAVVVLGLLIAPMAVLVWRSLTSARGIGLDYYVLLAGTADGALSAPVWEAVVLSLSTAAQATVIAVTLGVLVSLVVSRRPRSALGAGSLRVLDSLFMLPLGVS
ncbi:MAG: ABC transporter permease subunit, partial [Micropruina sp.]